MSLIAFGACFAAVALLLWLDPPIPARVRPEWVLGAIAGVGAVAAVLADTAPTGWEPLDALARAGLAVACTVAAWTIPPRVALAAAAIATVAGVVAGSPGTWLAAGALGAAIALEINALRAPVVSAVIGGLTAQSLLRIEWPDRTGASLAAGALAAGVLLVPWLAGASPTMRRRVVRAGIGVVAFVALGAGLGLLAASQARDDVDRGIAATRAGLEAIDDDPDEAQARFAEAGRYFDAADDSLGAFWARPAYAVPVVAQHVRAASTLSSAGSELSALAADGIASASLEDLRVGEGAIDLESLHELGDRLDDARDALQDAVADLASSSSPWLLGEVQDWFDTVRDPMAQAAGSAEAAADVVARLPALLGEDGPRRYFLAIETPAEARGTGGFMGNWGVLDADGGRVSLSEFGRIAELTEGGADPAARTLTGMEEYLARYGHVEPTRYWGVTNFTPDFPTLAEVISQLYPQSGGEEIDGVISLDPYAFAAFLRVTGPISVQGWPERLTDDNAAEVLLHEQYVEFSEEVEDDDDEDEDDEEEEEEAADEDEDATDEADPRAVARANEERREAFLQDTTEELLDQLLSGDLPDIRDLSGALLPALEGRHIQLFSRHADEQQFFDRVGVSGRIPALEQDSIGFVTQNYGGNKIDWFLHRQATYDVGWDPDSGATTATLTLRLENGAPDRGLPHAVIGWGGDESSGQLPVADGENLSLLTVYSALPLVELTVDGGPVDAVEGRELGRRTYTAFVRIPSDSTVVVEARFEGDLPEGSRYVLDPVWQPVVNPDELDVHVRVADGWEVARVQGAQRVDEHTVEDHWVLDRARRTVITVDD